MFAPPNQRSVIDNFEQISPWMRHAIVSVEDKRFWTDPGSTSSGIARAVAGRHQRRRPQGASTIAQQFVKNALSEQDNRTILEKLREAAMAYNLDRRWSKEKILREYLNAIYFGNGAYGIESAARVYFGSQLRLPRHRRHERVGRVDHRPGHIDRRRGHAGGRVR